MLLMLTCEDITDGAYHARYVSGTLAQHDVEAFEVHYLACARCQADLKLAATLHNELPASEEAADVRAFRPAGSRNRLRIGVAATLALAASAVGVFSVRSARDTVQPVHRAEAVDAERPAVPQSPVGDVVMVERYRWAAAGSADRYRVRLYDATGTVIWETDTPALEVAHPADVDLKAGSVYLWEVAARVGFDRWVTAELTRFRVVTP